MNKTQMKLGGSCWQNVQHLPATLTLNVEGQALKQSDIVKSQGWIQLYEQKDGAKAAAGSAVGALKSKRQEVSEFAGAFSQVLKQYLGKSSPLLGDFGLKATERKVLTTQTKILAQARSLATRKARNTLGSVQKKAVRERWCSR